MKIGTSRESLLKPLQAVIGVVERRQTMFLKIIGINIFGERMREYFYAS